MRQPLISICIPAYKRPENIRRLLHSIAQQTFKDYEVIITDDSPDDSVKELLPEFRQLQIKYSKNLQPLGTPANWNYAISLANGEWIKIMHDDDWFATADALKEFSGAAAFGKKFIFSAYQNFFEETAEVEQKSFPPGKKNKIIRNPVLLLPHNIIGPPSVTLVHNSVKEQYDTWMKWRVDIDFYIRILRSEKDFHYINQHLVNVGISKTQVTNFCLDKPEVELPEGLLLLKKYGVGPLQNIWVYDAWWRILRNVDVRSRNDLEKYTPFGNWPAVILKMTDHQTVLPAALLKIGILSKLFMALSYVINRRLLKDQ